MAVALTTQERSFDGMLKISRTVPKNSLDLLNCMSYPVTWDKSVVPSNVQVMLEFTPKVPGIFSVRKKEMACGGFEESDVVCLSV